MNFKWLFVSIIILISFCLGMFFFLFERDWVDFSSMEYYDPGKPSIILDEEGKEFARFQLDKRKPVTFDKLPNVLIKAFVAAEDWSFFKHSGVSYKGIIRSFFVNLYNRRVVQGASTITQQLAKLMFLSYQRTFLRKVQEIFLAFQIEKQFTKEQILELYLNNVYFGRGIYGVEAACKRFWNKSVLNVTLDQAASLAAVAKSARFYSPLNSITMATKRRNVVLQSMLKLNFINQYEYEKAIKEDLIIEDYIPGNPVRLYIQEWIRSWAENKWGKDSLYKKGLKIKTTINQNMQALAEETFCKKIEEVRSSIDKKLNGGMIAIETNTGKIRVAIGGYDFKESQFNRTFQAYRQIGSSFKPFLYTSALKAGFKMDDVMIDEPLEIEQPNGNVYRPRNWNRKFEGPMTLLRALTTSNNIISIKTFLKTGPSFIMDWTKRFGLTRNLTPYPSSALGTAEATVEELATAFNVFANYGIYVKPYMIEWVKDEWGEKLWENETEHKNVLDSKTNSIMVNALSHRIKRAHLLLGKPKEWINAESIGKTGATNDASSTWFVGSTPELTSCVYIGRDDNKPIGENIFASKITFPIWLDFNKKLKFKNKHFYVDPELHEVSINWITGQEDNRNNISVVKILK